LSFIKNILNVKKTLEKWYHDVLTKNWKKPHDVIKDFVKARTIKNNRVIIKFIGSHADYDKIDAETIDLYSK